MKLKLRVFFSLLIFPFVLACSRDEGKGLTELKGKRVFIAKGNISFILPDSTLKYSKPRMCGMGPDCPQCGYHLFCGFYSNSDSSIRISAKAFTNSEPDVQALSEPIDTINEKRIFPGSGIGGRLKSGLTITSNSITRTVEVAAHITLRGRPFYAVSVKKFGPQRTFYLDILAPDNTGMIQAVTVTRSSLYVKASFLNEPAKPYPGDIYKY